MISTVTVTEIIFFAARIKQHECKFYVCSAGLIDEVSDLAKLCFKYHLLRRPINNE